MATDETLTSEAARGRMLMLMLMMI